jgi:hypothetical protein
MKRKGVEEDKVLSFDDYSWAIKEFDKFREEMLRFPDVGRELTIVMGGTTDSKIKYLLEESVKDGLGLGATRWIDAKDYKAFADAAFQALRSLYKTQSFGVIPSEEDIDIGLFRMVAHTTEELKDADHTKEVSVEFFDAAAVPHMRRTCVEWFEDPRFCPWPFSRSGVINVVSLMMDAGASYLRCCIDGLSCEIDWDGVGNCERVEKEIRNNRTNTNLSGAGWQRITNCPFRVTHSIDDMKPHKRLMPEEKLPALLNGKAVQSLLANVVNVKDLVNIIMSYYDSRIETNADEALKEPGTYFFIEILLKQLSIDNKV